MTTKGIIVISIVLVIIITVSAFVASNLTKQWQQLKLYPLCGIVTRVNTVANKLYITDSFGDTWIWYGTNGYSKGNHVAMIMDSRGTADTIEDDAIIQIRFMCY